MKITLLILGVLFSELLFGQSDNIVPIILDGQPAFLNTVTGKVVSKKEATFKKYGKIKLNGFSSEPKQVLDNLTGNHIVTSGDTLYSISRKYGISVSLLKEKNQLQSNIIQIGQVLIVQDSQESTETVTTPKENLITHTVSFGETLYSISRKYGISIAKLKKLNSLMNNTIKLNQELIVQ